MGEPEVFRSRGGATTGGTVAGGRDAMTGGMVVDGAGGRDAMTGGTVVDGARDRDAPDAGTVAAIFVWDTWRGLSTDDTLAVGCVAAMSCEGEDGEFRIVLPRPDTAGGPGGALIAIAGLIAIFEDTPAFTWCSALISFAADRLASTSNSISLGV